MINQERIVLSGHAAARMEQRGVTFEEVLAVILKPARVDQADGYGRIQYTSYLSGRLVCVTVDALSDVVITVVAPELRDAKSPYGWFSLGSAIRAMP
jgi:hypothetical protein